MEVPELRWETSVFQDPDGGSAILWPYLPCVRMPMKMRPREWDAWPYFRLQMNSFLLERRRNRTRRARSSFGICDCIRHYIRDASPRPFRTPIRGPAYLIPRGSDSLGMQRILEGMPIFSIEPGIDDQKWADWQSRWADEQVRFRNLIATFGRNRRWAKTRIKAVSRIQKPPFDIPNDLVAAAAVCAAWWAEEFISLTPELSRERDERYASRIRGQSQI